MSQTALITGASKGLGRAIALKLAAQGLKVIAVARPSPEMKTLATALGGRGTIWEGDATSDEFLAAIPTFGTIDLLVNNLGTNRPNPIERVSDEDLDFLLTINIRATYRITRMALNHMQDGSNIINMSSQMGHIGASGRTVYCLTKHAMEGFTKALAIELAERNIRVNAVAPTYIDTPLTEPMFEDKVFHDYVMARIPLGRRGTPEDVADAVLYLHRADMVTGHSLLVDGGWTAQ